MNLIEKINVLLSKKGLKAVSADGKVNLEAAPKVEMKARGMTAEGIEVVTPADTFDVGAEVFIMDADGNPAPAPDGEHIIDGVLKIKVTGGKIEEVETVEVEQTLSAEVEGVLNAFADRISELEAKIGTTETALSAANAKLKETEDKLKGALDEVVKLRKAPGAISVTEEGKGKEKKDQRKEEPVKLSGVLKGQAEYISKIAKLHAEKQTQN